MWDFCLKNDLVLGHLDDLKRSKNHHENQAYFWSYFGSILGFILEPKGRHFCAKMVSKSGSWSQGGPKWSFWTILDLILKHLGPHGGPKWSFWTIWDLILEHFRPHFGQVSNQYPLAFGLPATVPWPAISIFDFCCWSLNWYETCPKWDPKCSKMRSKMVQKA